MADVDKRVIYTDAQGNLCVLRPTKEWFDKGNTLQQLIAKDIPQGATYKVLSNESELPADRYFRGAWEHDGEVRVNMDKARDIHLTKLRAIRDEELKKLDTEVVIATGKQDHVRLAAIEIKKQALRDMPPVVLLAMATITTPEELKNYKPEVLK